MVKNLLKTNEFLHWNFDYWMCSNVKSVDKINRCIYLHWIYTIYNCRWIHRTNITSKKILSNCKSKIIQQTIIQYKNFRNWIIHRTKITIKKLTYHKKIKKKPYTYQDTPSNISLSSNTYLNWGGRWAPRPLPLTISRPLSSRRRDAGSWSTRKPDTLLRLFLFEFFLVLGFVVSGGPDGEWKRPGAGRCAHEFRVTGSTRVFFANMVDDFIIVDDLLFVCLLIRCWDVRYYKDCFEKTSVYMYIWLYNHVWMIWKF